MNVPCDILNSPADIDKMHNTLLNDIIVQKITMKHIQFTIVQYYIIILLKTLIRLI